MSRLRFIPWILGVALIVTTVAGANRLLHSTDPASGSGPPVPPAKPPAALASEGLVAKGWVHSDPPMVPYTLPAHLASGSVVEVFVQSGQEVKAGDPLLRYDSTLLTMELQEAENAYNAALQEAHQAQVKQKLHPIRVQQADLAVLEAEQKLEDAKEALELAKSALEKDLNIRKGPDGSQPLTPEQKEEYRRENVRIFEARTKARSAENDLRNKKLEKAMIDAEIDLVHLAVNRAAYYAESLKRKADRARQAIADCTLRAKSDGIVEQVTASKGMTVYPQTRPVLYLVPSGKRVVWAEVVPDFAHKIVGRERTEVTISDDSNTHLTYKGTVKRIGGAFLPKPNGAPDIINGKANVVLIVEIEVLDATPAGKPPLRVGQPVRVSFQ